MRSLSLLVVAALWACGSSDAGPPGEQSFQLRTPKGITLVQNPAAGEPSVRGLVEVVRTTSAGDLPVAGALVKLGDLVIPEGALSGTYDLGAITTPLAPSAVGTLTASEGMDAASVTFQCPPDVSLTAPSDNGTASPGDNLFLTWTGRIAWPSGTFAATAQLRPWNPGTGTVESPYSASTVGASTKLAATQTSATLTIPSDGKTGTIAELVVPGLFADQSSTGGKAICILERRARLRLQ